MTRLHLRYDGEHFTRTCTFARRRPRNFQGRYVLRHPWRGEPACEAAATIWRPARALRAAGANPLAPDPLADRGDPQQDGSARPVVHAAGVRAAPRAGGRSSGPRTDAPGRKARPKQRLVARHRLTAAGATTARSARPRALLRRRGGRHRLHLLLLLCCACSAASLGLDRVAGHEVGRVLELLLGHLDQQPRRLLLARELDLSTGTATHFSPMPRKPPTDSTTPTSF